MNRAMRPTERSWCGSAFLGSVVLITLMVTSCNIPFHNDLLGFLESSSGTPVLTRSPTTVFLVPGESSPLAATVDSAGAALRWTTDNPDVVTVGPAGLVTAAGPGTTTVTASTPDGLKGTEWQVEVTTPGTLGSPPLAAQRPLAFAMDPASGTPYLAISAASGPGQVWRWNGSAWVQVGANFDDGNLGVGDGRMSLVIDQGIPYVAYYRLNPSPFSLVVKTYNGTAWVEVGLAPGNSDSRNYTLAIDGNHHPIVGYNVSNTVEVKVFDGTDWGWPFAQGGSSFDPTEVARFASVGYDTSPVPFGGSRYVVAYVADSSNTLKIVGLSDAGPTLMTSLAGFDYPVLMLTEISRPLIHNRTVYFQFRERVSPFRSMLFIHQGSEAPRVVPMSSLSASLGGNSFMMPTFSTAVDPRNGTVYVVYTQGAYVVVAKLLPGEDVGTVLWARGDGGSVQAVACTFFVDAASVGHLYVFEARQPSSIQPRVTEILR